MSSGPSELPQASLRTRIRDEATEWFARSQTAAFGPEEQAQLDGWLAQSHSHRAAYWRLEGAWEEAGRLVALRAPRRAAQSTSSRRLSSGAKLIAASLALTALAVVSQFNFRDRSPQTYATDVGGRKILKLTDGSQIELNTNTSIRMDARGTERKVWLDKGEAYFQIVHDRAHPFAVIAGNHRIVDLGTKFVVRQKFDALEVSLVEGRARVEITGNAAIRPADLAPGDVAVASSSTISVTRQPTAVLDNQLGWRRGVLIFKGTTLAAAAAEMNRYNAEKLVVTGPGLARETIDGTFPIHAVSQFTEMAKAVFGLRAEKQGAQTIISR